MEKWIKTGVIGTYLCFGIGVLAYFFPRHQASGGAGQVNYLPLALIVLSALLLSTSMLVYKDKWPFSRSRQPDRTPNLTSEAKTDRVNLQTQHEIQRLTSELQQKCQEIEKMKADCEAAKLELHWPHLKCGELTNVGFVVEQKIYGAGLKVENDELRYDSTAHNVRACIRLRHMTSNRELVVDSAVWHWYEGGQDHFGDKVSLGMTGQRQLLIFLWDSNTVPRDFRIADLPLAYLGKRKLEHGVWSIKVKLVADNFIGEHETSVTLTPFGGIPGCS